MSFPDGHRSYVDAGETFKASSGGRVHRVDMEISCYKNDRSGKIVLEHAMIEPKYKIGPVGILNGERKVIDRVEQVIDKRVVAACDPRDGTVLMFLRHVNSKQLAH